MKTVVPKHFEFYLYEEIPIELSADQDVQYFKVIYTNYIIFNIYFNINMSIGSSTLQDFYIFYSNWKC